MTEPRKEPDSRKRAGEPGTTSLSLIARWQRDDAGAWERVVHLYYPLIYGWCRRAGLQPEDARDVTQEVFVALARDVKRFRSEGGSNSFRGWLWGVTRNQQLGFWRKRSSQPQGGGGTDHHTRMQAIQADDQATLYAEAGEEDAAIARRALELIQMEFEDRTWRAFWQTAVEQKKPQHVAEDLDMSVNAVYLAKSRVLRRLRLELDGMIDISSAADLRK